ncbi:MAG TPA: hypothetical protein VI958_00700 [Acidobacteriota bacterium]
MAALEMASNATNWLIFFESIDRIGVEGIKREINNKTRAAANRIKISRLMTAKEWDRKLLLKMVYCVTF